MVRNTASMQSLRSSMADCNLSPPWQQQAEDQQREQPYQVPLQRLDGPVQLFPDDAYTKTLMTKVATGQATEQEQVTFDKYVQHARSLPSINNLVAEEQPAPPPHHPHPSPDPTSLTGPRMAAPSVELGASYSAALHSAQEHRTPYGHMMPHISWQPPEYAEPLRLPGGAAHAHQYALPQQSPEQPRKTNKHNLSVSDLCGSTDASPGQNPPAFPEPSASSNQVPVPATTPGHALADFQMQLSLLEAQNKKRLLSARQGATAPAAPLMSQPAAHELRTFPILEQLDKMQDYQSLVHLLEQQNKRSLQMARNEHKEGEPNRKRFVLIEAEQRRFNYGMPNSSWEKDRTRLLDTPPRTWERHQKEQFEQLWRSHMLREKLQRRKSKGLAATLAANYEAEKFKPATRENAAKYTRPFCHFMTENPTVFHCVDTLKTQLKDAGFTELSERDGWNIKPSGSYYVERNGSSLIAFSVGANYESGNGAAILAGHVDALTARLKPISQVPNKAGYLQLGVAPYASGLNKTWWDRDLGIGGRVHIKEDDKIVTKLVKLDWPIARIPSLAEHFGAPAQGPFNKETQMVPIIGLDTPSSSDNAKADSGTADPFSRPPLLGSASGTVGSFVHTQPPGLVKAISNELGLHSDEDSARIVNWELELFDVQPATVGGLNKEFIFAGRIDDKLCSWAALQALLESQKHDDDSSIIKVVGLFDDEEIGSLLRQGARGNFLPMTIERAVGSLAGHTPTSDLIGRTYANSFMVSSDVTHAVNPNFLEVYLANHAPHLNVGIAVAADSNGHMTTDSVSTTILKRCADKVGAKLQVFQIRNDSRSGGTVGPMLSSAMGVRAIDAGLAQLSMHSIRATTGALDPGLGVLTFAGFLNGFESVDKEFRA